MNGGDSRLYHLSHSQTTNSIVDDACVCLVVREHDLLGDHLVTNDAW
jgi:hypothetical protein